MLNSSFKKPFHLRLIFTMDKNSSDGVPLPQRYGAILTIVLGLTMAVLDGAIANVALPTIASDLNASPAASIWIVNAYQIAIVIALLPLSFLGDMVAPPTPVTVPAHSPPGVNGSRVLAW